MSICIIYKYFLTEQYKKKQTSNSKNSTKMCSKGSDFENDEVYLNSLQSQSRFSTIYI